MQSEVDREVVWHCCYSCSPRFLESARHLEGELTAVLACTTHAGDDGDAVDDARRRVYTNA